MSRVLKSSCVVVDEDNRIRIKVMEPPKNLAQRRENEQAQEKKTVKSEPAPEELIDQAKKGADLIIRNAQANADEILRKAEELAEEMAVLGKEEGMRTGYDEGYAQGLSEASTIKGKAQEALDEAVRQREQLVSSIEDEVLTLIVKVVKKLLTDTIYINPQVVLALIKAGLANTTSTGALVIRVSEQDYDMTLAGVDELSKWVEASNELEIVKDLSLKRCDCVIETPFGCIDCSLDGQFNSLVENLRYIQNLGDAVEND